MILILKKTKDLLVTEWFLTCSTVKYVEKLRVTAVGLIFYNEEWLVV